MKKIVIAGYHGFENAGDDATLISMVRCIRKINKDYKIVVLSKKPELTESVNDVKAINRLNIFSIVINLLTADTVVFGGGTLLQDTTSQRSLKYYAGLIWLSKFLGKKVMIYSNGMGPFINENSKKLVRKVLNKVDLITLRENFAKELLEEIGVSKNKIAITADSAFMLGYMLDDNCGKSLLEKENIPRDKKIVGVSIREYNGSEIYKVELAKLCDYIYEKYNYNILFIPFQYSKDLKISAEVMGNMKNKSYVINSHCDVCQIMNIVSMCDINICMRLHSMIFSALSNKPVLGLIYDPKVQHYLEILKQRPLGIDTKICFEDAKNVVDDVMTNYEDYKEKISKETEILIANAGETEKLLKNIIKK